MSRFIAEVDADGKVRIPDEIRKEVFGTSDTLGRSVVVSTDTNGNVSIEPKSSVLDQIRWERDVAIDQLKEIGCGLGEDMTDVKVKIDSSDAINKQQFTDLKDAIAFCLNRAVDETCNFKAGYEQLTNWLIELRDIRKFVEPLKNFNTNNLYLEELKGLTKTE